MKTAIIVHGVCEDREEYLQEYEGGYGPPKSDSHWYPWVAGKLCLQDILTQRPEMPNPYIANGMKYDEWAATFENFKIDTDTILIGHSAGCGFLLKYLSQNPGIRCQQLILVAPWTDPAAEAGDFMKGWDSDLALPERIGKIELFYSTDDDERIIESVRQIRKTYPSISTHEFTDKGHFCLSEIGREFPEILEVIKCTQ